VKKVGVSCILECSLVEYKETESSESQNAKVAVGNNVGCILYAKDNIPCDFVLKEQTVNSKFYKDLIKRLITRMYCIRPRFQESGP
jgi:hypothetical protein